ncbi:hypothetical protein J4421_06245 [Candidatus Woesearchaeota archaeon]|nr:hypothetical protein [Candidatus Woesearchaeota archaeon]
MVTARQFFYLSQVLAVFVFGVVALSIAQAHAKSDFVLKTNIADEIKMMVDTLVAVPGEALVKVPYNTTDYSLLLTSENIAIFKKGENKEQWTIRPFFLPEGYHAQGSSVDLGRVCLEKKGKSITLRRCLEDER